MGTGAAPLINEAKEIPQIPQERSTRTRFKVPVSIAGVGAVFYGISMFSMAGGNMTTALVVASNVDFVPTIAAMLIRVAPYVIFPVIVYIIYNLRVAESYHRHDEESRTLLVIAVGLSLLIALYVTSAATLLTCFLVYALHGLHLLSHKKKWRLKFAKVLTPNTLYQLLCAVFVASLVITPSWLASETVDIDGNQRVISVIKETDEFLYYLDATSSRVMYAKPTEITKRAFCGSGDTETLASLVDKLAGGQTYPSCPRDKA